MEELQFDKFITNHNLESLYFEKNNSVNFENNT